MPLITVRLRVLSLLLLHLPICVLARPQMATFCYTLQVKTTSRTYNLRLSVAKIY